MTLFEESVRCSGDVLEMWCFLRGTSRRLRADGVLFFSCSVTVIFIVNDGYIFSFSC